MAISSATPARWGSSSDISCPLWPWRANVNCEPASVICPPMKAKLLAFQQSSGTRLAVVFHQLRLGIEQVELRRRADHVQIDDPLGRREVRMAWGQRIDHRGHGPQVRCQQ